MWKSGFIFAVFFSKVANVSAKSGFLDFGKVFYYRFFFVFWKIFIETFPKFGQIWKLFRDDYHNLKENIHP